MLCNASYVEKEDNEQEVSVLCSTSHVKENTEQEVNDQALKLVKTESKSSKSRGAPTPCPICGVIICNKYNLSCHIRRHNNDKPYKCEVCPKAFILKTELQRHRVAHSKERPFKCNLCPKSFKILSVLRVHIDTHGVNEYKCRQCDATFKDYRVRGSHERNSHRPSDAKLKCRYCYKTFSENMYREEHELNFHGKNSNTQSVRSKKNKPSKLLKSKERRNVKRPNSDTNFKFYPCKVCSERFKYRLDQLAHYEAKHKEQFDKVFKVCKICGKILTVKHYSSHMQVHEGNMPYACSQCEYKSARKEDLKAHSLIHTKEFYFHCSKCQRPFRNRANVLLCENRHSGKKDVKCKDCDKTFFSRAELRSHEVAKHKFRTCSLCGYETLDRYLFYQHRKVHCIAQKKAFPAKSYMCDKCGSLYCSHFALMTHSRIHAVDYASNSESKRVKICSYCNYQGLSNSAILSHCIEFHPAKVNKCEMCSYSTLNINHFLGHIRHHTRNSSEELFLCTRIKKAHEREDNSYILECFICGFSSFRREQMETHIEKHKTVFEKLPWFSRANLNLSFTIKNREKKYKCKKANKKSLKEGNPSDHADRGLSKFKIKTLSESVNVTQLSSSEDFGPTLQISDEDISSEPLYSNKAFCKDDEMAKEKINKQPAENMIKQEKDIVAVNSAVNVLFTPKRETIKTSSFVVTDTTHKLKKTMKIHKLSHNDTTHKLKKTMKIHKLSHKEICSITDNNVTLESHFNITKPKYTISDERIKALKTKLRNINGKLFFPLEDLHSLGNFSKEALLRVLEDINY